jgi:mycoredoxin
MLAPNPPGANDVAPPIVYTTSWCGYCARLKYSLDASEVLYTEVDIEAEPAAAEIVTAINHGNRTVPTVVFADGTSMTNPPATQVEAKIRELAGA